MGGSGFIAAKSLLQRTKEVRKFFSKSLLIVLLSSFLQGVTSSLGALWFRSSLSELALLSSSCEPYLPVQHHHHAWLPMCFTDLLQLQLTQMRFGLTETSIIHFLMVALEQGKVFPHLPSQQSLEFQRVRLCLCERRQGETVMD